MGVRRACIPTSGIPVISGRLEVSARRSSGSRSWTLALPQARAIIWISSVIAVRKLATRCGGLVDGQARHQLRILGGDADRAAAGVAVMAGARLGAERLVVLDVQRRVAVERDQRGGADVARVGAERQGLGDVDAAADAAGRDELDLAVEPEVLERAPRLDDRGQRRDARVVLQDLGRGAVPPSMPSTTTTSAPHFAASFTSSKTRVAPIFTKIGTRQSVASRSSSILMIMSSGPRKSGWRAGRALVDARRQVADARRSRG